ncbi:MAG: helix-turn-helix transcriptional regulator [Deltaproteobacteria bacterium]|nr:helix-turn-helix transcriptional regulator [Deltaproteobacteria bacterium]
MTAPLATRLRAIPLDLPYHAQRDATVQALADSYDCDGINLGNLVEHDGVVTPADLVVAGRSMQWEHQRMLREAIPEAYHRHVVANQRTFGRIFTYVQLGAISDLGRFSTTWSAALDAADVARVMFRQRGGVIGWLGVLRGSHRAPFSPGEVAALQELMDPVVARLSRLEAPSLALERPLAGVVGPDRAVIGWAPPVTDPVLRAQLQALTGLACEHYTPERPSIFARHGLALFLTALHPAGEAGWLVRVEPTVPLRIRPVEMLSARQRQLALRVAEGGTLVEVARELGISYQTAKTHLKAIYLRLEVANRVELMEELAR